MLRMRIELSICLQLSPIAKADQLGQNHKRNGMQSIVKACNGFSPFLSKFFDAAAVPRLLIPKLIARERQNLQPIPLKTC